MSDDAPASPAEPMPRWVWKAVAIFWFGAVIALLVRDVWSSLYPLFILLLVSLFLSLAIEPGVNRLARRGWRRGTATTVILVGVLLAFLVFLVAIGALVGQQIADLLGNSEKYVNNTVDFLNTHFHTHIDPTKAIESINDPEGPVHVYSVVGKLTLHGTTRVAMIKVRVKEDKDALVVTGEHVLKQTDYGIEPYSTALGAVGVQDEVRVSWTITAKTPSKDGIR